MNKKLLWIASSIFAFLFFSIHVKAQTTNPLFQLPDSVCVGSYITPTEVIDSAKSYSWDFCPPDFSRVPDGFKTTPIPSMNDVVGIVFLKQDGVKFTYHLNSNGDLIRSRYLDDWEGNPSLIRIIAHIPHPGGLYAIKMKDGSQHIFVLSGTDSSNSKITRFDFANGVQTYPSDTVSLGTFKGLNGPNQLFIAREATDWYGFTFDKNDHLIKLSFGDNILDTPTVTDMGNIDNRFDEVSGLTGIVELGDWHLFATNKHNNTVDRINFGNSLNNVPFVVNLGNFNFQIQQPVGITITRVCGAYYGFILNAGTNHLIILKWDASSIAAQPNSFDDGVVAGVEAPTVLSNITQEENGTFVLFGLNPDNSISKILYKPCTQATQTHSDKMQPTPWAYDTVGYYTVYLTINLGYPRVKQDCHTIRIYPHATMILSHDTLICEGDKIPLRALTFGADSLIWTPNYRIDTTRGPFVEVNPLNTTKYVVTSYYDTSNCIVPDTVTVSVSKIKVDAGPDRTIRDGSTTILGGAENPKGKGYTYRWTPDIGIIQSTATPITKAKPPYDITYYLHATNLDGCRAIDTVNVRVPCDDIHLPNAFTPESTNSKANKFGLLNLQIVKINSFKIFNRWGQLVFSTTNPNEYWNGSFNGKPAPMGVYVWEVDGNCINTGQRYQKTGTVTLIR